GRNRRYQALLFDNSDLHPWLRPCCLSFCATAGLWTLSATQTAGLTSVAHAADLTFNPLATAGHWPWQHQPGNLSNSIDPPGSTISPRLISSAVRCAWAKVDLAKYDSLYLSFYDAARSGAIKL